MILSSSFVVKKKMIVISLESQVPCTTTLFVPPLYTSETKGKKSIVNLELIEVGQNKLSNRNTCRTIQSQSKLNLVAIWRTGKKENPDKEYLLAH